MNNPDPNGLTQTGIPNHSALVAIYDEHHLPVYRYIYRQVGETETARDLTAEVFRRFLQTVGKNSGVIDNIQAWLYRSAHNVVIDHYRHRQHQRNIPLEENNAPETDDPAESAERQLLAGVVRLALKQLTPEQQQVISLKFLQGLSNQEVSAILNKPVSAVKSLQNRALASLHKRLASAKEILL